MPQVTSDAEALDTLRHSTAHLMAHAVKRCFKDKPVQITIGPVIADGFYYDFSASEPFHLEDLPRIEKEMRKIAKANYPIEREEWDRSEAIAFFRNAGEHYKAEIIESIPEGQVISLYRQGEFIDLCRGPHVSSTGQIKHFKLMRISGAYWRGDSQNEMLQRIYGTAWLDEESLEGYLKRLEEAEKRDHRKIGKQLGLFHLQEEAPGMVFWHPNGCTMYHVMQDYIREKQKKAGYLEIKTPQVVDRTLWEKSGHWDKYREAMFTTEVDDRVYAIKPMSCPCHVQIFNSSLRSYRELPLRFSEFGSCHRYEPSGSLHGLLRVRSFVQDDGHVFCTEAQIGDEASSFDTLLRSVYADFGLTDVKVKLSTRPAKRVGSDALWDKAERMLTEVLDQLGHPWELVPGEGAFYGPKLEYSLSDSIGRVWQLGTLQLDFSTPERLGAAYVAEDSSRQVPVMLHRAVLGTFERFLGILIEHHAGLFPVWLAPVQVVIMNITDRQADYVQELAQKWSNLGFRVQQDLRNEKIGFKIREHTLQRVPYLLVVGDREAAASEVSVRTCRGKDLGPMPFQQFEQLLKEKITAKSEIE